MHPRTDVRFARIRRHHSYPHKIWMFFVKVNYLNLFYNQILVVLGFDLLTVQFYESRNDDYLLFYGDFYLVLMQLP